MSRRAPKRTRNSPPPVPIATTAKNTGRSNSEFAAQILGQPGLKRGLRGGPETLDSARSTYLSNEYSGQADRRPAKGKLATKSV